MQLAKEQMGQMNQVKVSLLNSIRREQIFLLEKMVLLVAPAQKSTSLKSEEWLQRFLEKVCAWTTKRQLNLFILWILIRILSQSKHIGMSSRARKGSKYSLLKHWFPHLMAWMMWLQRSSRREALKERSRWAQEWSRSRSSHHSISARRCRR